MPQHKPHGLYRIRSSYARYDEHGDALERCPNCHNERIGKTPRRKGGPTVFRCRKCGYITNVEQVNDMHRLLGHTAA